MRSNFTFITGSTQPTVVLKCLPDQLIEFLKYDRQCITAMQERITNFMQTLMDLRNQQIKGEKHRTQLLYPV